MKTDLYPSIQKHVKHLLFEGTNKHMFYFLQYGVQYLI